MRLLWNGYAGRIAPFLSLLIMGCSPLHPTLSHEDHIQAAFYVAPSSRGGSDINLGTRSEPFLTLERARKAVRNINEDMTGDILVYVRDGVYELERPLVFQAHDSGQNGYRVIYKAYPGEHPVVTGGHRISGWIPAENGVFKTNSNSLQFRQLYVNGQPRIRARTPNEGSFNRLYRWDESDQTIVVASSELPKLSDTHDLEMVIHKEWTQNNLRLRSYYLSDSEVHLILLEPDRTKAFSSHNYLRKKGQSYYFENAYEFLDADGEWYLRAESNEIFYKPRAGEDMSTIDAVAPKLDQLIRLQGTPQDPVKNIQFSGIVFECSTWLDPSKEGFATGQADNIFKGIERNYQIPGAIHVQNAENIRFEGNILRNLGATAIVLRSGVRNSAFVGNTFQNISASGISIGMDLEQHPTDPSQVCRDNVIKNNFISKVGRDYHSSVGIFAGYTEGLVIENNELADLPYTGISVGWGHTLEQTPLKDNLIRRNRIHNVMSLLADGAGIYTLSKQPGTRIIENYVFNIVPSPWAGDFGAFGIYLDEGSSLITLANNLLENVPVGIILHRAEYNTVINNWAPYKGVSSFYNDFIRRGDVDPEAIRAKAGIDRAYAASVPAIPLQP